MSETLKARIAQMLAELRAHPAEPPRVIRDGAHVVVRGSHAPLREDFVSSGREHRREPAPLLHAE